MNGKRLVKTNIKNLIVSSADKKKLEEKKTEFSRAYLKRWTDSGIDALIMPVLPWVAFKPKTWVKSRQIVSYTALWNLLNYACLTIPATTADATLDQPDATWTTHIPRSESDQFNHQQCQLCVQNVSMIAS
jgi:amidase